MIANASSLHALARSCLGLVQTYVPGKPVEEVCREYGFEPGEVTELASNESPIGPSPRVVEAIKKAVEGIHIYPESSPPELIESVAAEYRVSPSQVVAGNGLDNIITMVCQTFIDDGKASVMSEYTFLPYEIATLAMGGRAIKVPMREFAHDLETLADRVQGDEGVRLLFLCNPNNPTGAWVDDDGIRRLIDRLPSRCLLVLDEAYADFADKKAITDGCQLLRDGVPVIVLRTFSKAYGLTGLRIGFALADEKIISSLLRVREAFPLNRLTCVAAKSALQDREHTRKCIEIVRAGRRQIYAALEKMGVGYLPSQANFIMMQARPDADTLVKMLLKQGIVVRSLSSWGLRTWIRVSIGTKEQNERFLKALGRLVEAG